MLTIPDPGGVTPDAMPRVTVGQIEAAYETVGELEAAHETVGDLEAASAAGGLEGRAS